LAIVANAGDTGAYLLAALRDALADHPHVGDIRGEGMLAAVEFVENREGRHLFDPSRKIGPALAPALLARSVISASPPPPPPPPSLPAASSPARCRRATSSASRRRSA